MPHKRSGYAVESLWLFWRSVVGMINWWCAGWKVTAWLLPMGISHSNNKLSASVPLLAQPTCALTGSK